MRPIFHSNPYNAEASCEHCAGIVRHEEWCITMNERVFYAYEVVIEPCKLDYADRLILHALGVSWACAGHVQSQSCST